MEFLKQQRENKLQRMKELESQKLPEEFLEDLATSEPTTDENPVKDENSTNDRSVDNNDVMGRLVALSQEPKVLNTRKVFDDQPREKKIRRPNKSKVLNEKPKEKKSRKG